VAQPLRYHIPRCIGAWVGVDLYGTLGYAIYCARALCVSKQEAQVKDAFLQRLYLGYIPPWSFLSSLVHVNVIIVAPGRGE